MLKYVDSKVTFQEVPDEISLCISLSGCPHRCEGCHSSYLWENKGKTLNFCELDSLVGKNKDVSCICFMGGDNNIPDLFDLVKRVKEHYKLRVAWYTGFNYIPMRKDTELLDYIKIGEYNKNLGPLTSPSTNQKFYINGKLIDKPGKFYDITNKFWRNESRNN